MVKGKQLGVLNASKDLYYQYAQLHLECPMLMLKIHDNLLQVWS